MKIYVKLKLSDPFISFGSCAACMVRIKTGRTIKVEALCDFSDSEKIQKVIGIYYHIVLTFLPD